MVGSFEVRLVFDAYLNFVGDEGKNISFIEEDEGNFSKRLVLAKFRTKFESTLSGKLGVRKNKVRRI